MSLSPLILRRIRKFKSNKRGYFSFWIFIMILIIISMAKFITNDQPPYCFLSVKVIFSCF